jgi:hypothetical protein
MDVQARLNQVYSLLEVVGGVGFGFGVRCDWRLAQEGLVQGQDVLE